MSTSRLVWFKSSFSGSQGDDCVEVGLPASPTGEATDVRVRDSKDSRGPTLLLPAPAWQEFVRYAARR